MSLANIFLFAAGAAALAFPLWIHLRLGRVKKRAVVSSLRLMRAAPQTSRRPRRIVDLPLLLLRALIFLLFALAFGRLLIPGMPAAASRKYEVFVVDVSGSMQAKSGDSTCWNLAHEKLLQSLQKLNASSRVAVVLSPSDGTTPEWKSPAQALEQVKALTPGYGANRLSIALRDAKRLLGEMPDDHPKAIHLFSDFQQSAFSGIDEVGVPAGIEMDLVKVGEVHSANRGVAVTPAKAGLSSQSVYSFNDGSGGKLSLVQDGKSTELTVASGEGAARMSHAGKNDQWLARTLESKDDDAIAIDNTAYDAFRGQEPIPVWLWEPQGELPPDSDGASHVYEQASYYIRRALQPAEEGEEASPVSRYRPKLLSSADLAAGAKKMLAEKGPQLLIVPVTGKLPDALGSVIGRVLENGGAVIYFGGPGLDPVSFKASAGVVIGAGKQPCPSPALDEAGDDGLWAPLDPASQLQMARAPLRLRHALTLAGDTTALVSYADGVPFVTEHHQGKGRVYFVNTSADRSWGDWAASAPLFIPAMHLLAARALDDGTLRFDHEPVLAGEVFPLKLGASYAGRSLKAHGKLLPVNSDGLVSGVRFDRPGIEDLQLEDGTPIGRIAINFPPSESVLESFSQPVALQRLESLRQQSGDPVVRWDREEQGGTAWRICLFLAALLLVTEPVIATYRGKP
ncbi:MAG: hypothetical protein JWO82_206 [Akkermansiaceae bacterium]|nr:hypothetical protein [Akkermansiaceae bacterium]